MTEHTKTDGLPGLPSLLDGAEPQVLERARPRNERMAGNKIECNACPVLCQISEGKSDAERWLGPGQANVRVKGAVAGPMSTAEYGSQMLSLGGVHHLTGGSKKEGRVTVEMMQALGNKQPGECGIEGGAQVVIQAGRAPIVNGVEEQRMRVGCGSATIGIFAKQFYGRADEVVVV